MPTALQPDVGGRDVWADPAQERLGTSANLVTAVRTVLAVALAAMAAERGSVALLVASLAVYWVGDALDGFVARIQTRPTSGWR